MPKKGTLDEIVKGTVTDENKKGTTYRQLIEETNIMAQQLLNEAEKQRQHEHSKDNGKPLYS